jgi:hypothetical protein
MDEEEYQRELHKLLGVQGPMGELVIGGAHFLAYKMPDGSCKHIETPTVNVQRAAVIKGLRIHLGLIEARRNGEKPCDDGGLPN